MVVQLIVQLHPMHPPGDGPWLQINFGRALLLPSRKENVNRLDAVVQHNFRRTLLVPSREENISSLGAAVQPYFRHALRLTSRENIKSLGAAVQHNFRRKLLVPSREENISSLGAAVQPYFRRTLLVPSREENIKRISIAWAPQYSKFRSQAKIPGGAKSFTMKSTGRAATMASSCTLSRYTGCKAKRQRVQLDPQRVQLHCNCSLQFAPIPPTWLRAIPGYRGKTPFLQGVRKNTFSNTSYDIRVLSLLCFVDKC